MYILCHCAINSVYDSDESRPQKTHAVMLAGMQVCIIPNAK